MVWYSGALQVFIIIWFNSMLVLMSKCLLAANLQSWRERKNPLKVCMNRSKMSPNRVKCDGVQKTSLRVGEMEMSEQVM